MAQESEQSGRHSADFTPKPMPRRDDNAPVIDMNFNLMNRVIKSILAQLSSLRATLNALIKQVNNSSGGGASGANPTASVGLTAANGAAATFMRSDAAPPLDQGISPVWTSQHEFDLAPKVNAFAGVGNRVVFTDSAGQTGATGIPGLSPGDLILHPTISPPSGFSYTGQPLTRFGAWAINCSAGNETNFTEGATASIGDYAYFIGGNNGTAQAVVQRFGTAQMREIVSRTNMPSALKDHAAAASASLIYVTGGANNSGTAQNILYIYTPGADTWHASANVMPGVRKGHSMVYHAGTNKLYVFGGWDGTTLIAAVWIYDIASGVWSTGANLPVSKRNGAAAIIGNYVYYFGGYTSTYVDTNYKYDIAGDSFSTVASMPFVLYGHAAVANASYAMSIGGLQISGSTSYGRSDCYIYDPVSDIWVLHSLLENRRYLHMAALINNEDLVAVGGYSVGSTRIAALTVNKMPKSIGYVMSKN